MDAHKEIPASVNSQTNYSPGGYQDHSFPWDCLPQPFFLPCSMIFSLLLVSCSFPFLRCSSSETIDCRADEAVVVAQSLSSVDEVGRDAWRYSVVCVGNVTEPSASYALLPHCDRRNCVTGYCSRPGPKGATSKKNFVCNRGRPVCQACELSVHCRSGTICIRFKISAL
jgi:hypothetical protein